MNNIDSVQVSSWEALRRPEFSDGLVAVNRAMPEVLSLPVQVSLVSADVSDKAQLESLYPMACIADYPISSLRPAGLDPEIFSAACFRDSLSSLQRQLQLIALERRSDARKFGRLSRLLSDQDALFRLAQMYSSALVQG